MLHLGIDIGGTKMEAVLLDPAGECVQRLRRPTHKESYDAFMRQLLTLIADIRAVSPQPFTLGIGLPGAIDPQSGRIKNCNCLVLNGHDLRRDIMQQLGQPVWMANDADCFTLSEAVDGAGAGATTVFGVIIGTGCGGGIAVHQQLLSGPNAIAGEWGHNPLPGYTPERDGPPQPCYCGKTNCIESFLSRHRLRPPLWGTSPCGSHCRRGAKRRSARAGPLATLYRCLCPQPGVGDQYSRPAGDCAGRRSVQRQPDLSRSACRHRAVDLLRHLPHADQTGPFRRRQRRARRGLAAPASRRRARAAVDTFFSRYVKLGENVQTEKAMPTIDDVSRLANVSRATVSRVLTGTRGVREESREAVLRAVEELNYRPSFAAQNLASQTSSHVGLVISAQDESHGARLLPLLSQALKGLNKSLLVQYVSDPVEQAAVIDDLQRQCVAVVVLGAVAADAPRNVIAFDRFGVAGSNSQGYDFAFATESACRYVIGKGHRNIALLVDSDSDDASRQMLEGYRNVLQNYSIPFNRQLVLTANDDVEQALLTLINSFSKYSVIIVKRDRYAAEAMRLLREFTIAVPQEVSLLSLEDSPLASLLYPPLTCISWPLEALLDNCIQRIRSLIDDRPTFATEGRSLAGRLIPRQSVADIS
ncbi:sugar binding transcriptional regulator LacI family [Klebsiella pneumoniae]|nr:sugar binding transcriptional regulator LacI family [Klebsiella pneumoniae]